MNFFHTCRFCPPLFVIFFLASFQANVIFGQIPTINFSPPPETCNATDTFSSFSGVDYLGNDIQILVNADVSTCKQMCLDDCRCVGYVVSSDASKSCSLKSALENYQQSDLKKSFIRITSSPLSPPPPSTFLQNYGMKFTYNTSLSFPGNDIKLISNVNLISCIKSCLLIDNCAGIEYGSSLCKLKSKMSNPVTSNSVSSSIRIQGEFSFSTPNLISLGSSSVSPTQTLLNTEASGSAGAIFFPTSIQLTNSILPVTTCKPSSFKIKFTLKITPNKSSPSTGDGAALILAQNVAYAPLSGQFIGYAGNSSPKPSLAIEFDTFNNNPPLDISDNHVGINVNGSARSLKFKDLNLVPSFGKLADGAVRYVWVDYDAISKNIQIFISTIVGKPSEAILSYSFEFCKLFGNSPNVFLGFSGASGEAWERNEIVGSVSWASEYFGCPGDTSTFTLFTKSIYKSNQITTLTSQSVDSCASACLIWCNCGGFSLNSRDKSCILYSTPSNQRVSNSEYNSYSRNFS